MKTRRWIGSWILPPRLDFPLFFIVTSTEADYLKTYKLYEPLFAKLTPEAKHLLLKGNYERIFDEARIRVRKWEADNIGGNLKDIRK